MYIGRQLSNISILKPVSTQLLYAYPMEPLVCLPIHSDSSSYSANVGKRRACGRGQGMSQVLAFAAFGLYLTETFKKQPLGSR